MFVALRPPAAVFAVALLAGCAARSPHRVVAPSTLSAGASANAALAAGQPPLKLRRPAEALRAKAGAPAKAARAAADTTATSTEQLSDFMAKVRHLSTALRPSEVRRAPTPEVPRALTLEERDPELAADLKALLAAPTAELYRHVAERYRERGVLDAAYRHFNQALALNPRDAAAYDGLARVWRDWGLPQLGLADAHRATFYAPQSASAQNTYGTLMQALGRYRDARNAYELASWLDPHIAYPLNNLCYLAFLEGKTDAAIQTCKAAIKLDPSLTAARNNLALAFAAAGRLDLARAQFLDDGDRATGLYNIGIVYLAAGDRASALAVFDEASRTRVPFALARERANQLRTLLRSHPTSLPERGSSAPGPKLP